MPIVIPANGFFFSNSFFMAASTGMYCAAHSIFSFPELMKHPHPMGALKSSRPVTDYPMNRHGKLHKNSANE
jgi:hypothetical protein